MLVTQDIRVHGLNALLILNGREIPVHSYRIDQNDNGVFIITMAYDNHPNYIEESCDMIIYSDWNKNLNRFECSVIIKDVVSGEPLTTYTMRGTTPLYHIIEPNSSRRISQKKYKELYSLP